MAGDIGWEAVTLKGELAHRARLITISLSSKLVYVTTPAQFAIYRERRLAEAGLLCLGINAFHNNPGRHLGAPDVSP